MMAVRTTLSAKQLPDALKNLRRAIEKAVPHGRTNQVHLCVATCILLLIVLFIVPSEKRCALHP